MANPEANQESHQTANRGNTQAAPANRRPKTALVAGGAGFIGSHLCDFLLARKYRLLIVDNFITGARENLAHLFKSADSANSVHLIEADIREPFESWLSEEWQSQIDEIYNLASPASPVDFGRMPIFILTTAARGHQNLLEIARRSPACRILLASTSEVYGDPLEHPQREEYWGHVNCIGPRGCYDEAKRFSEALTMAYHREYQISTRIVRIFNTYGPRMRPTDGRVICNFMAQGLAKQNLSVYGSGKQTRSFCYVSDLVRGLWLLVQSDRSEPVNIGNPGEYSILEIATAINKLTQNPQALRFEPLPQDDPQRRRPDIRRAQEWLGWNPEISLDQGLQLTLDYFRLKVNT